MSGEATDATIELRLTVLSQLFNSLDPSPFHDRDLDKDAETHIVEWARELPRDRSLRIVLHLPEAEAQRARVRGVETALANYFSARARSASLDLRELLRTGRRNLVVSVPLLVACLLASQALRTGPAYGALQSVLAESLVIVGWVANWKPLETFLFDWWPIARRRDLYRRLAAAQVEIHVDR